MDRGKSIGLYFLAFTSLMIYQHSQGWAWDFIVYSLNGQYLFHEGVYMEWKRPPLLPVILGVLQYVMSMRLAEYIFIVACSAGFLHASFRLGEKYSVEPLYIYVLTMSPMAIFYSTFQGTELLSLVFLALMLADLQKKRSGLWLGLAFLTRYTGAFFAVLLLFQRDPKKTLYSLSVAAAVVFPWLVFNHIVLGHPLASLADTYALDVAERGLETPFEIQDLFLMTGLSIPLALNYLKEREIRLVDLVMSAMFALVLLRQVTAKMSVRRYLFEISLPAAFLAAKGLNLFKNSRKLIHLIGVLHVLGGLYMVTVFGGPVEPGLFQAASEEAGDCVTVSNQWPFMSYAGTPTGPLETHFKSEEEYIEEGFRVVEFDNGSYSVEGDQCLERPFNSTYIERLDEAHGAQICEYLPVQTCGLEDWLKRVFLNG